MSALPPIPDGFRLVDAAEMPWTPAIPKGDRGDPPVTGLPPIPPGFKLIDGSALPPIPDGFRLADDEGSNFFSEAGKGIVRGAGTFAGSMLQGGAALDPAEAFRRDIDKYRADLLRVPTMRPEELDAFRKRLDGENTITRWFIGGTIDQIQSGAVTPEDIAAIKPPAPIAERELYKAGTSLSEAAQREFPVAPGWEGGLTATLSEGFGSLLAGFGTAVVGGPAVAGAGFTAAGSGEAAQRAIEFDAAEKAAGRPGLSEEQIATAAVLGVGPGATDLIPIETMMGVLRVPAPFRRPLARAVARIGGQAFIEGVQEGGQQYLQNLIAQEVYNPEQDLGEGVLPNVGAGAGVGGIAQTLLELIPGRSRGGRTSAQPQPQAQPAPAAAQPVPAGVPEGAVPAETILPPVEEEDTPEIPAAPAPEAAARAPAEPVPPGPAAAPAQPAAAPVPTTIDERTDAYRKELEAAGVRGIPLEKLVTAFRTTISREAPDAAPNDALPTPVAGADAGPVAADGGGVEAAPEGPEAGATVPGKGGPDQAASVVAPLDADGTADGGNAPAVVGFKTAKGSIYTVNEDGGTTRIKAARSDPGHEGDSGLKEPSAKTVYLDPKAIQALAPPINSRWRLVDMGDGTFSLATLRPDGQWGVSPSARNIKASTKPAVGLAPLEMWQPETVNGRTAYGKIHPGNPIVEITDAAAGVQGPQPEAVSPPAPSTAGAGAGAPLDGEIIPPVAVTPDMVPDGFTREEVAGWMRKAAENPDAAPESQREIDYWNTVSEPDQGLGATPDTRPQFTRKQIDEALARKRSADGTRAAPAIVETADDLAAATAVPRPEPTEAQKEAGNYAKTHVKVQGFDIAIENPKGSIRSGKDRNGETWSVKMPIAYGYIKRTEGADGDQVDVYVGERPQVSKVFVVDQVDADTKAFDEHKVFMGVPTPQAVRAIYSRAFSDGRGPDRLGAITPMTIEEFKAWLRDGDMKKPAAQTLKPEQPEDKAPPKRPAEPPVAGDRRQGETTLKATSTGIVAGTVVKVEGRTGGPWTVEAIWLRKGMGGGIQMARVRDASGKALAVNASTITKNIERQAPSDPSWKEIGTNEDGAILYQNPRGLRSMVRNGIRVTEPVPIVPTRGGIETPTPIHKGEWRLASEIEKPAAVQQTEHPGLVVKSLQTGRTEVIQPPGTVPPRPAEPTRKRPSLVELTDYAKSVIQDTEAVDRVTLIGSVAATGEGNDIDLLYDLNIRDLPRDSEKAAERVQEVVEAPENSALDAGGNYDSFFKVGDRYFHLATGAGSAIVENTSYAKDQAGRPTKVLAERPGAAGAQSAADRGEAQQKALADAPTWAEVLTAAPKVNGRPDTDFIFRLMRDIAGGATKFTDLSAEDRGALLKAVREETAKVEAPRPKSTNKLFTDVGADAARARIRAKLRNQVASGIDPELLADGAYLTGYHIEKGIRSFLAASRAVAEDLGVAISEIRPYLRSWYNGARDMMEDAGLSVAGMDGPEEVRAALQSLEAEDAGQGDLRQAAQGVPAEASAEPVSTDAGGGDAGGAPELGGPGGVGDGRNADNTDGGPRGPAEGLPGAGRGTRADSARRRGNRAGRGRASAAPDELNAAEKEAEKARAGRSARNYRITDADAIGQGGPKEKVRGNIEAIRVLKQIEEEKREATDEEKRTLVRYVGWGAFAQDVFASHKAEWAKEQAALKDLMSPDEYAAARGSTLNAHYTSEAVIRGIWKAVEHLGFSHGRALEPSAGVGHFIGLEPGPLADRTDWSAVELDSITGRIAKLLYADSDVNVMGFEKFDRPDDFYDLAISNVPFGAYKIRDTRYPQSHLIHDYFFIKSLDKVRPGGLVAFVTSSGTMDKAGDLARIEIAERADFVGAIRLPGGKRGAFSGNAGTEVTTDILFLRRRIPGVPRADFGQPWMGLKAIASPDGEIMVNEYFAAHPDMMLGEMRLEGTMYRDKSPVLVGDPNNLEERIAAAARAGMPANIVPDRGSRALLPEPETAPAAPGTKPGAFFIEKGKVFRRQAGVGIEQRLSTEEAGRVTALVAIRDVVNKLLARPAKAEAEKLRADLNRIYDAFVRKHGPIGRVRSTVTTRIGRAGLPITIRRMPNFASFKADPDAFKVLSLENYDEESDTATKAAIFREDILGEPAAIAIKSGSDAMAVSLDRYGRLVPEAIGEMLGMPPAEAMDSLGSDVFLDPKGDVWRPAGEYLSGDVLSKLDEARASVRTSRRYERNVAALEAVQPAPLTRAEIKAQFGAPWVPADVFEQFLGEEVGGSRVKLSRNKIAHAWALPDKWSFGRDAQAKYGTDKVGVGDIVSAALNNLQVRVTYKDEEGKEHLDQEATEQARVKVKALRQAFAGDQDQGIEGWAFRDEDRAARLEDIYNRTFNRYVGQKIDGSHLTFPGLARSIAKSDGSVVPFTLRQHQKDAVWRVLQNGNTLLAHVVGAGKTFTMIAAGMEQKRLGLIRRPMYVVPNHMLEQFSREFLQAYPAASILVADKESMSRDRRQELAGRIAAEKWDAIVITHDAFGRIGMSPDYAERFMQEEIAEYMAAISQALDSGESRRSPTVKQLERRKKQLDEKLAKLVNAERKDVGATFEELGVDFLFVDEAHLFKNLPIVTKMTRVKGLGGGDAQRATDLFMKIRYLEGQRRGRSAVFATGTPISNTISEMYTMQRYLQLPAMREHGVDRFDAWAATFGEVVSQMELAPDGRTFVETSAFSRFVNIPELVAIYSQVADTRTADMLKLPRPELAKGKDGRRAIAVVEAEPAPREEAYINSLVERARQVKGKRAEKGGDNMLKIVSEGRKVATDFRLIAEDAPFNPNGKIALLVDRVADIWKRTADLRSAQIVFLDMGTPKTGRKAGTKAPAGVGDETVGVQLVDEDGNIVTPSMEEAEAFASSFNLYEDIRARLVERGVPRAEIAFIHEATDDAKKATMFDRVRKGQIRVLIGSTGKMGVGTNVQNKLIAMHHVDAPWKPAEVEQRDGRILRQGNENPEVEIFRYITKRSFDSFMWQTLERKAKFIGQLQAGARGVRTAEDIDDPLPEAAQLKAAASGDLRIVRHAELSKTVRDLEAQRRSHYSTIAASKSSLTTARSSEAMLVKALDLRTADAGRVVDLKGDKFSVDLSMIDAGVATKRDEAGSAVVRFLAEQAPRVWGRQSFTVGLLSGFKMGIEARRTDEGVVVRPALRGEDTYEALGEFIFTPDADPGGLIRRFENLLSNVVPIRDQTEAQLAKARGQIPRLAEQAKDVPFPREQAYREASDELKRLTADLSATEKPPSPAAGPPASQRLASTTPPSGGVSASRLRIEARRRQVLERALSAIVRRIAGKDVSISFEDRIAAAGAGDAAYQADMARFEKEGGSLSETAGGEARIYSNGEALVRLALADPLFDPTSSAYHEAYHVAEATLMADAEFAAVRDGAGMPMIELAARQLGIPESDAALLPGYEIRAIAFERYARARDGGASVAEAFGAPASALSRFFERLRRLLAEVKRLLGRQGITRVEDIFEAVYRGDMAGRERGYREITSGEAQSLGSVVPHPDELGPFSRGGAEARRDAMTRAIEFQPIDRAIRLPFDIFGGLNQKGEWKPGLWLADKAKTAITSARFSDEGRFAWMNPLMHRARAGLVDRYGLDDEYVARERRRVLEERAMLADVPEIMQTLAAADVGPAEARVLHDILTGERVADDQWALIAEPIRNAVDAFGQEAVELGLLSAESYERNKGSYLHRVYLKHEGEQTGLARWVGQMMTSRRKRIIGDQFKGRGLWQQVDAAKLIGEGEDPPPNGARFNVYDRVAASGRVTKRVYVRSGGAAPEGFVGRGQWEVRGRRGGQIVLWRDFTKAERERMGEITDARYTIAKTYMMMAHDLAVGRFYLDIAANADWTTDEEPRAGLWKEASEYSRFWADPTIEWVLVPTTKIPKSQTAKYGALAGKFIRAEIWRDIHEIEVLNRSGVWSALLTQWKLNKALALDTPIPTPSGWTTMGAIRVGDQVFDETGAVCLVEEVKDIAYGRPCYEVAFSDGTKIVADEEHFWFTIKRNTSRGGVRTTGDILRTLYANHRGDANHSIPVSGPLALPEAALPLPPYALGLWLGDGDTDKARLTIGGACVAEVEQHLSSVGVFCGTQVRDKRSSATSFTIDTKPVRKGRAPNHFKDGLRSLGVLGEKRIPEVYLRASISQRRDLLQGLIDSDGWVTERGTCGFATSAPPLRDGVLELMRSLGFKPTTSEFVSLSGATAWRIHFQAYADMPIARLSAKACRLRSAPGSRQRSRTRQIVAVTPVPSVPVRCIAVSSKSHLYLAGTGMVPTHNTARSPVVHMNNVISNFALMDMSGVGTLDLVKAIRSMAAGDETYRQAAELGAFGADMATQEIRRNVLKPILEEIERDMAGVREGRLLARFGLLGKIAEGIWSKAKAVDRKMLDLYRLEDEVFRLALFVRRRAQGIDPQVAADEAREQFIDYDIRAPWVNAARRTVLPFIAYTYRAVPIVARTVMTRPWKLAKYAAVAYAANALSYLIFPGDEDRERRSLREEEQGTTWIGAPRMIRMPFGDMHGNPVFLDIRRWIPAGDVFDASQGHDALGFVPSWLQLGGPLMLGMEIAFNKQAFTGEPITNDLTDDPWDRAAKIGDWAWKGWVPSAAWVPGSWYWTKIGNAITGARDWSGRPYDVGTAVASSLGIKFKPQDVEQGFTFWGFEFDRIERELKMEMGQLARDRARGLLSQGQFERARAKILDKLGTLNERRRDTFVGAGD